jgi:hypothetical protein
MTEEGGPRRSWLRPVGLFGLTLALSVGQPLLLVLVPFAFLALILPGEGLRPVLLGLLTGLVVFLGPGSSGLWHIERGWAILVGGWFAAVTLAWPASTFLPRALAALGGAAAWTAAVLLAVDGWERVDWLVEQRVQSGAAATLEMMRLLSGGEVGTMQDAVQATAQLQVGLFPALLGLASIAGLGVAWWFYLRLASGSGEGLGPLRNFRFPDAMIWVLIAGGLLVLMAGWSSGWGRVGANMTVFMGALFVLRGAAVLLFLSGGIGIPGAVLLAIGFALAAPVLLAGAMVVGVGDSWVDLRARALRAGGGDAGRD